MKKSVDAAPHICYRLLRVWLLLSFLGLPRGLGRAGVRLRPLRLFTG